MLGDFVKYLCLLICFTQLIRGEVKNISSPSISQSFRNTTADNATNINETLKNNGSSKKDLTHHPRENVKIESSIEEFSSTRSIEVVETTTPIFIVPKKNDGKLTVPKKGVDFMKNISAINVTETSTRHVNTTVPSVETSTKPNNVSVISDWMEPHEEFGQGGQARNYTVIAVSIMFSLPLVALLVLAFYKLGSEWWQHRHYRRMDFLIEGMYNN